MKLFLVLQSYLTARLGDLRDEERGATMVEYGLMVALIAVVVAVSVQLLGQRIAAMFDGITFP